MIAESLYWAVEFLKVLIPTASVLIAASAILQTLERGRRELAVSLIYNWANDTDWSTSRSINIAKELPPDVITKIDDKEGASIPAKNYDGIISVLKGQFSEQDLPAKPNNSNERFQITSEQSAHIRFLWVRWLNRLEGTLAAWQQGAADVDLMTREFKPLVEGKKAELRILATVREGLPIIAQFYDQMQAGGIQVRPPLRVFPFRP
jgi:hypothetical protein